MSIISMYFFSSLLAQETETSLPLPDPGPLMEPDPVKFSFETPGWYVLAAILIIIFLVLFIQWFKKYRANAYRREAVKEINSLQQQSKKSHPVFIMNQIMVLLKQVAMHTYGRQKVASLAGDTWFSYLEAKGKNTPFKKIEQPVSEAIYQEKQIEDKTLDELVELSKRWIKTHA